MKKVNVNDLLKKGAKTLNRSELKRVSGGEFQETTFPGGGNAGNCGRICNLTAYDCYDSECNVCRPMGFGTNAGTCRSE
ncbi:hypothetical protein [Aquimarina algiphila]|uniref:hypothetical protein n=1 Tax=Aquimarina algiphila TaxID=2047982 RepID=UPI00232D5B45|nr:hypothetical protein [Aquimarina algiphila]